MPRKLQYEIIDNPVEGEDELMGFPVWWWDDHLLDKIAISEEYKKYYRVGGFNEEAFEQSF